MRLGNRILDNMWLTHLQEPSPRSCAESSGPRFFRLHLLSYRFLFQNRYQELHVWVCKILGSIVVMNIHRFLVAQNCLYFFGIGWKWWRTA
jgi:hypothetical protein